MKRCSIETTTFFPFIIMLLSPFPLYMGRSDAPHSLIGSWTERLQVLRAAPLRGCHSSPSAGQPPATDHSALLIIFGIICIILLIGQLQRWPETEDKASAHGTPAPPIELMGAPQRFFQRVIDTPVGVYQCYCESIKVCEKCFSTFSRLKFQTISWDVSSGHVKFTHGCQK